MYTSSKSFNGKNQCIKKQKHDSRCLNFYKSKFKIEHKQCKLQEFGFFTIEIRGRPASIKPSCDQFC